jgi:DNA-binding HTH domain-containing proteins
MAGPQAGGFGWASLTETQRTVAKLVSQAKTNGQIARRMNISPHTVNYHLRQIFRKLRINSRVELALLVPDEPESPRGDRDRAA